ncbi:hypothetical protein H5410_015015, partial [Solanum commersonii]
VPSIEGENYVSERKEQSACAERFRNVVIGSPRITELEDTEGQSKKVIEVTKGRIAKLIDDPNLLIVVANATLPSCFWLARERGFKTKITELMACGYWVVMGSSEENES